MFHLIRHQQTKPLQYVNKNKKNKITLLIPIILLIVLISSISTGSEKNTDNSSKLLNFPPTLNRNSSKVSESNQFFEIESKIIKWEIYDTWQEPDFKLYGVTPKIEIPENAKAIKVKVSWEGTNFLVKGYGKLKIDIIKLVNLKEHNKEVSVIEYSTDINTKWTLDNEGNIKLVAYVEDDALFYHIQLMKANIGDCIIEVYFGY